MEVVRALHETYCRERGLRVAETTKMSVDYPLDMSRVLSWQRWAARGWGADDLALVIRSIRSEIGKPGGRNAAALNFRRLIEDIHVFEDELAAARDSQAARLAAKRKPGADNPARTALLRATGRSIPETPERPVADVLPGALETLMNDLRKAAGMDPLKPSRNASE